VLPYPALLRKSTQSIAGGQGGVCFPGVDYTLFCAKDAASSTSASCVHVYAVRAAASGRCVMGITSVPADGLCAAAAAADVCCCTSLLQAS
jgi:hypothetical protein